MAEKKYVSLSKLSLYDEKIKAKIAADDASTLAEAKSYSDSLGSNYDAAGAAATVQTNLEAKIATAQSAADAADAKAAAAQSDVDALETYVGTIPETASATDVVGYIDEKTAGIATDAALESLTNRVTAAEKDIDAIEDDYLKTADKTEVVASITSEANRAKAAEEANATAIKAIADDYLKAADKASLESAIATAKAAGDDAQADIDAFMAAAEVGDAAVDTLKEIQDYIESDGAAAAQMTANIASNATAIEGLTTRMGTAEGAIDAVEEDVAENATAIAELQAKFGDGEGSVSDMIADAVAAEKAEREAADAEVQADADQGIADAAAALAAAQAAQSAADAAKAKADANETALAGKAATADLTALTTRMTTAEGEIDTLQSEMDAVEALAAANKAAHEANASAIALKASQADLEAEITRAKAAEEANAAAIAEFVEVSEEEINALFQ